MSPSRTTSEATSNVMRSRIIAGEALATLRSLPMDFVDCVITSPPYFLLRDYQHPGQLGLEDSVSTWVAHLQGIMTELARVLKPEGSVWLNLGDSYSRKDSHGAVPKSLLLGPERLVLALSADGWTIRNKVIWAKTNPMPASVGDRLNTTWEALYLLTRSRHYYFDLDAIRQPQRSGARGRRARGMRPGGRPRRTKADKPAWAGPLAGAQHGLDSLHAAGMTGHPLGKNPGDVWPLPTANFRGAHFAVFPEALAERPLLASCPERICTACGKAWRRERARRLGSTAVIGALSPMCRCAAAWRPGLVLDPFIGSGTVAVVAERHGRDWLGIEINRKFVEIAERRIRAARDRPHGNARTPPADGEATAA